MKRPVDLLITGGTVCPVDSSGSVFEAMAIDQGKVVAVGTTKAMMARYMADSVMDVTGKFIFPGFIDAHCHFYGFALGLQYVDLVGCTSFDEVVARLKEGDAGLPGSWLVGRGWDQNLWAGKQFPDRAKLDALYPDRPVMLIRIDGHSLLANQAALTAAGISLPNRFQPGEVEVKNGRLTGILSENAADHMRNTVPVPDDAGKTVLLKRAQELCFAAGLTGVGDAGLEYPDVVLIDTLQKRGELSMFIYAMLSPTAANLEGFVKKGPYETDRLSVRSVKVYADGSLGSRTALLKRPYADDPAKSGILVTPPDTIRHLCELAARYGYQVNAHCIGDSSVSLILGIYSAFLKGKNDLRWRIEHAQVVDPADLHLFGDYSVIPSVQATHATSDMYWAGERLGAERIKGAYAYRDLMMQNGWIPNGTDFPIEQIRPLLTFYAATMRRDLKGFPSGGFQPENALTREEALKSITLWAARAGFGEQARGSLEAGKQADFVILDRDLMTIPGEEIPLVNVLETWVGGKQVYKK